MYPDAMTINLSTARKMGWGTIFLLGLAILLAAGFVIGFAIPFFSLNQHRFGIN